MNIDLSLLQDRIVEEAVDELTNLVRSRVESRMDKCIDKLVSDRFAKTVDQALAKKVEEIVLVGFDREYFKLDGFGRPSSEPTTIAKELDRMLSEYWTTKVDSEGRPTQSQSGRTRAIWLMSRYAGEALDKYTQQLVVNSAGILKDELRTALDTTTASMLDGIFKVRSIQDQKEDRARYNGPATKE